MKKSYLRQGWLVLLLALVFGAALAGVQTALGPRIKQNKRNEIYDQIPKLVAGADKDKTEQVTLRVGRGEKAFYKAFDQEGTHVGWVIKASGQGFVDVIELLIGLDAEAETITALYVLENKETPALGNKIKGEKFRGRFANKPTDRPLEVTKTKAPADHEIRAISGATVSSESVTRIVNEAVAEFRRALAGANR